MNCCRLICTCHPIHDLIAVFRVRRTDGIDLISIVYVFSLKVRLKTEVYPVLLKLPQSKILNPKPVVISKNGVVNLLIGTQVIFHGPVSRCGAFNAVSSPQISLFHFYAFTSGTKPFPCRRDKGNVHLFRIICKHNRKVSGRTQVCNNALLRFRIGGKREETKQKQKAEYKTDFSDIFQHTISPEAMLTYRFCFRFFRFYQDSKNHLVLFRYCPDFSL